MHARGGQTNSSSLTMISPRQHFSTHSPRLLDAHGELVDTVSRTAHVPPPKIVSTSVRRTEIFVSSPPMLQVMQNSITVYDRLQRSTVQQQTPLVSRSQAYASSAYSPRSVVSDTTATCNRSGPPIPPKPVLRPFQVPTLAWPMANSCKSNSLPRRRAISGTTPARSVKWRNDVIGGASGSP
jgi:hypothetical protein